MHTKLLVDDAEFLADFMYVKTREIWPEAVVLDREADLRFCRRALPYHDTYGFDIFRSEVEVALYFSGEHDDPPPSVHLSWALGTAIVDGEADVVQHLAHQPLWSSS